MAKKRPTCNEILRDEVWTALGEERVVEAYINGDAVNERIHGLADTEGQNVKVTVNPAPMTVDTVIHELIHLRRPRWGEKRVVKETRRIMRTLDDRQIRRWWRKYERVKSVRTRPVDYEEED